MKTDQHRHCQTYGEIQLKSPSGYLATRITQEYGYGSSTCPWAIQVPTGQVINVTLYNYGGPIPDPGQEGIDYVDPSVCYEIAKVYEDDIPRSIMTCGTDVKVRTVYMSQSNSIKISFINPSILTNLGMFLLKYEGRFID